jgi:hypothetical protein
VNNHSDREWLVPMAVVAACQFALWSILWTAGFAKQPLFQAYSAITMAGLVLGCIPFVLWYVHKIYREGEAHPISRMKRDVRPSRVLAVAGALVLAPITASSFGAAKSALHFAVPFYLDVPLANFERALFGQDPWRISHSLLGWATPAIDRIYLAWLVVMLIGFNLVLLSKPSALKTRSLIAYLVMWPTVGTIGSYLSSSAGPIFYHAIFGGSAFSDLIPALQHAKATGALSIYDHLWRSYATRDPAVGGGISAMPSMHVALACWLALTIRAGFPRFQWAGWAYLALIWIGSVHLGWHYVVDGFAGIVGAALVWAVAPHMAFRRLPVSTIQSESFAK